MSDISQHAYNAARKITSGGGSSKESWSVEMEIQKAIDAALEDNRAKAATDNGVKMAKIRDMVRTTELHDRARYVGPYADDVRFLLAEIDARDNLLDILQQDHELYAQGAADLRRRIEKAIDRSLSFSLSAETIKKTLLAELADFSDRPPLPPTKAREEIDRLRSAIEKAKFLAEKMTSATAHSATISILKSALEGE
jgi:hypothetical protein